MENNSETDRADDESCTSRTGCRYGHQAERIAELVGQVKAQAAEIERLTALVQGTRTAAGVEYALYEAEIKRLRSDLQATLDLLDVERTGASALEQQRADALALADEWDAAGSVGLIRHDVVTKLRAALGAADEPTTGGGSDA